MWYAVGKWFISLLTGGSLEKILDVINNKMSEDTRREELKAEVTETWIKAQASLLVGRTWWFQLFFVLPAGLWFSAVCIDSIMIYFSWWGHTTAALPEPINTFVSWIISALFLVDGSKAILGRFQK